MIEKGNVVEKESVLPSLRAVETESVTMETTSIIVDQNRVEAQDEMDKSASDQNCAQFCRSLCTKETVIGVIIFIAMIAILSYLVAQNIIEDLRDYILSVGFLGYFIFFLVIAFICQPFAVGYTPVIVAVGFVYGWPGLALSQISVQVGCLIAFFECRYCGQRSLKERLSRLQPKLKLIVKKLDSIATKDIRTAYPFMIFARNSPLSIGLVNGVLALTDVSVLRFYATVVLGSMIEQPISINLGIILAQTADMLESTANVNFTASSNNTLKDLEEQEAALEGALWWISISVTILFLLGSCLYTAWMMKRLRNASEEDIRQEIEELEK